VVPVPPQNVDTVEDRLVRMAFRSKEGRIDGENRRNSSETKGSDES
jgi:hypothetical protein